VKRDDQTGLAFGGNKTRKLEFLVGEALAQDADLLLTAGALQSNHCRQTAAAAAKFGMGCRLVLFGERPARASANLWLDQLFGADLVYVERSQGEAVLRQLSESARREGRRPYVVPYGGSNSTGALGYAFAMREFVDQSVAADWIVFPSSSGGTQAGLMAGAKLYGFEGKLLGISVDEPQAKLQARASVLATETAARLDRGLQFEAHEALVNDEYCTAGYGVLTDAEREAVQLFARLEGLLLDPVYTGRAAAGLIELARRKVFKSTETVLFWHTGGTPALFAEAYLDSLLQAPHAA
jgi:D-cysteine desulfhydrase family pyridoxal phosphate-dependent enzyme